MVVTFDHAVFFESTVVKGPGGHRSTVYQGPPLPADFLTASLGPDWQEGGVAEELLKNSRTMARFGHGIYYGFVQLYWPVRVVPSKDSPRIISQMDTASMSNSSSSIPEIPPDSPWFSPDSVFVTQLFPVLATLGWHPHIVRLGGDSADFRNDFRRSLELHLLFNFGTEDGFFYGSKARVALIGFIREPHEFISSAAMAEAIRCDLELVKERTSVTKHDDWVAKVQNDPFFFKEEKKQSPIQEQQPILSTANDDDKIKKTEKKSKRLVNTKKMCNIS